MSYLVSYLPILRISAEIALTLFAVCRLFLFFERAKNIFALSLLITGTVLLVEKETLLGLPYFHKALPFLGWAALFMIVFAPEFSRLLARLMGRSDPASGEMTPEALHEIVKACGTLAQSRTGALLAIERDEELTPYIEKSVVIDAKVRHELLLTIFTPPTYLHDGGTILRGGRIVSCSAIFPLSENPRIKKDLGTRHRAAVGMSEDTDALCLVVSEETGMISVADRGHLYYGVEPRNLKDALSRLLQFKKIKQPDFLELAHDTH